MKYPPEYKGTCSIMLEDYSEMEGLMKQFLLMAPSIATAVYSSGDVQTYMKMRKLIDNVQTHLES